MKKKSTADELKKVADAFANIGKKTKSDEEQLKNLKDSLKGTPLGTVFKDIFK